MQSCARWSLLLCSVLLASCAGFYARSGLLPSLRADWREVKAQASREAEFQDSDAGAIAIATADEAIVAGDPTKIAAAPWSVVDELAAADIDRRAASAQLGQHGAALLREQLDGFRHSRAVFTRTQ